MGFSFLSLIGISEASTLEVGGDAPRVKSVDQDGQEVDLGAAYDKGVTLVYFYPKADTPGCTKQACSLRDAYQAIQDKGIQVFGVSTDKPEAQKKFKEKYELPFTLLADYEKNVMKAFGMPETARRARRQAFLVKDGKIAWLDLKASTAEQAKDVLEVVESWKK